jgi:hypothetical protein
VIFPSFLSDFICFLLPRSLYVFNSFLSSHLDVHVSRVHGIFEYVVGSDGRAELKVEDKSKVANVSTDFFFF